jgi:tetratricopeptide (TPR) repeat protein
MLSDALRVIEDDAATKETLQDTESALSVAIARAGPMDRAQLQSLRGFARVYLGKVREGQADFLGAAKVAKDIRWYREAADALGIASENARVLYDQDAAVKHGRASLKLRLRLGDKETCLRDLLRLAEIQTESGDGDAVLAELNRWIAPLGDDVRLELANYQVRLADLDAAIATLRSLPGGRARLLEGDAQRQLGNEAAALHAYRKAVDAFEKNRDPMSLGNALGNAGISLIRLGRARDARPLLEKAQMQFDGLGDRGRVAIAVLHRGDAHLAAGEAAIALRLFDTARTFAARTRDSWLEAEALVRRGRALLALGDAEPARRAFSACTTIATELSFQELAAAAALGEARCFLRQGRATVAGGAVERGFKALDPLMDGRPVPLGDETRRIYTELCAVGIEVTRALDSDRDLWFAIERQRIGIPRYSRPGVRLLREKAMTPQQRNNENLLRGRIRLLDLWEGRAREEEDTVRAAGFKLDREKSARALRKLIEAVQLAGRPGSELLFPRPVSYTNLQGTLGAGQSIVAVSGNTALVVTAAEVRRTELDTLRLRHVVLADLRATIAAESVLRVPSATEYAILRGRGGKNDLIVLDHPPSARELRGLFSAGSLRILAPRIVVAEAEVLRMRERVTAGKAIRLPRSSSWSWFGRRE